MTLGELNVHIYYYMLSNIFYIKLLCMHDAMTCSIVAILQRCTYSKCLNPTSHIFRGSAVGSALDLETKGCWFEPTMRHYFSSNNVHLLA